jgi:PDZ domain-containing protein
MHLIRRYWMAAALLAVSYSGSRALADNKDAPPASAQPSATAAEIGEWITQLNDDRYLVRERATRQLLDAGRAGLDQLQAAADADRPEPADRSVWIMRRLSNGKEASLKRQALEHLANLKKRPQVAAAAQQTLSVLEHQEAMEAIEQLGGNYSEREFMVRIGAIGQLGQLDLDERWHGGDADLVHLRHLNGMRVIRIVGTDLSAAAVIEELPRCATLQLVSLYGTKFTPDDVAKLRAKLPARVEVDYRKGALLGVASTVTDGPGPAVVQRVTPGSAADVAGITPGDVIQKFNGEPITNFKSLTQKIGDHYPGDEVTISIVRTLPDNGGTQPMEIRVKLGKWKSLED